MAMKKQFTKTQWNNDREPAITAEQLNRMEKGIDDNDTRIVELDKAVTANKTAGDESLAEVNKTLQKHTEDITAVNNELTSQSKAIGELADKKITKFYASSQGDTTLNDSDNGKMQDMMLYGKSEQKQYSGKNLLKPTLQTTTSNGIKCIANGDGTYTLNGIATENVSFAVYDEKNPSMLSDGKTYRLTGCPSGANGGKNFYMLFNYWDSPVYDVGNGTKKTFTAEKQGIRIDIGVSPGATVSNVVFKPMLVDNDLYPSTTYDDFEPYVGGIHSPNPDYPQEIKSVVEPVVKVTGKNLLKPTLQTTTQNGVTCTANGDGTYTVNGTTTANTSFDLTNSRSNITGSGTYKIIGCPFGGSGSSYGLQPNVDGVWLSSKEMEVGNGLVLSPLKSIENIAIFIRKETTVNNLIFKPMITTDLTATYDDFEPYTAQSVTLPYTLNAIPVSSGGNVTIDGQQYISDYVDVERGKIIRKIREMILTGSENWSAEADGKTESHRMFTDVSKNYATIVHLPSSIIGAICSHFIETSSYDTWNATQKNAFSFSANSISLHVRKKGILTVDELKSWLSKNNITIYYPLATPTEESLSDELAEKLKALQTYYPQTNLFITSNQLDGYAIFNYPISLANGWNYVKQQIGDTRDYIYGMDLQMAQAYVNSEYAVALTELEV